MKKNPSIAKTLREVCRLLSGWGLKDGDYAEVDGRRGAVEIFKPRKTKGF